MLKLKSHTHEDILGAYRAGETVWALDTGNDGADDTLIGERDTVIADILSFHELDTWPDAWTLDRVDWLDESAAMQTTAQTAHQWGLQPSRVRQLCQAGRVVGAKKLGRDWGIPVGATVVPRSHGPQGRAPKTN